MIYVCGSVRHCRIRRGRIPQRPENRTAIVGRCSVWFGRGESGCLRPGWPPVRPGRCRQPRNGNILHQAQSQSFLAFESWPRSPRGQGQDLPRPERWKHPLDHIPLGVALAEDISLTIDVKCVSRDHFGIDRNIRVWKPDSVEDQFQITFAPKMPRLFLILQVSCHVCTARECGMPEFLHHTDMTKYGITHLG